MLWNRVRVATAHALPLRLLASTEQTTRKNGQLAGKGLFNGVEGFLYGFWVPRVLGFWPCLNPKPYYQGKDIIVFRFIIESIVA